MPDTEDVSNGDLMLLIGRIDANVATLLEQATSHGARITSLERDRNRVGGALAVLAAGLGWLNHTKIMSLLNVS